MNRLVNAACIGLIAVGLGATSGGHASSPARQREAPGTPAALATATGGTVGLPDVLEDDTRRKTDFISFDGEVYMPSSASAHFTDPAPPLTERDLGPAIGRVEGHEQKLPTKYGYELCYEPMPSWQAPLLAIDTSIYAVRGYATYYRLAVWREDRLVPYFLSCRVGAAVGADLCDLRGRVERVRIDGAVVDEPAVVDELVGLVLAGAIVPEEAAKPEPAIHVVWMELDDGSRIALSVEPDEIGRPPVAIVVPPRFFELLEQAVQATPAASAGIVEVGQRVEAA